MKLWWGCWFWLMIQPMVYGQVMRDSLLGSPMQIPVFLSGSFGELRNNHFHAGIDIKTYGREGIPVFAPADGYVSRIKVSGYGYGKALYIDHPNGYTTVYGHLSGFESIIAEYVLQQQMHSESFELDLEIRPGLFPIKKDSLIAYSGNSGGSGGPHLHYEVRKTSTQEALNPQYYGVSVEDKVPPVFHSIFIYPDHAFPKVCETIKIAALRKRQGVYRLQQDTLWVNTPRIRVGMAAHDLSQGSVNRNGIVHVRLSSEVGDHYQFRIDTLSFSATRYILGHYDHALSRKEGQKVQRLFVLPGNALPYYQKIQDHGWITLKENQLSRMEIYIEDAAGNGSVLEWNIGYKPKGRNFTCEEKNTEVTWYPQKEGRFKSAGIQMEWSSGCVFDTLAFQYQLQDCTPRPVMCFSGLHQIHHSKDPLFKAFQLSIEAFDVPERLQNKLILGRLDDSGRMEAEKGKWNPPFYSAQVRQFGLYFVTADTTPPTITILQIPKGVQVAAGAEIKCKIQDNLSGIQSYEARLNDQWFLMEYDPKNKLLEGKLGSLEPGKHTFVIKVSDQVGNTRKETFTIQKTNP